MRHTIRIPQHVHTRTMDSLLKAGGMENLKLADKLGAGLHHSSLTCRLPYGDIKRIAKVVNRDLPAGHQAVGFWLEVYDQCTEREQQGAERLRDHTPDMLQDQLLETEEKENNAIHGIERSGGKV